MVAVAEEKKKFNVGTTGWRASDLDDPRIEQLWFNGRYEIIQGVLTAMPPAYFDASSRLTRLQTQIQRFLDTQQTKGDFAYECDIIIDEPRLVRADAVWLTPDQKRRQAHAAQLAGKADLRRTRILVPPTLVIESVSYGHEDHDRVTKFAWYAEFGVANYWIFDALGKTLVCYTLGRSGKYRLAAQGRGDEWVRVPLFKGLKVSLADLWSD